MTDLHDALGALRAPKRRPGGAGGHRARGVTSDLSIDETLLLHSIGWEPTDLVYGVAWWSVPWGVWQWQSGEVVEASSAFAGAMEEAASTMRDECAHSGGSGVIGVEIELHVSAHYVSVSLAGTAIRRIGSNKIGFEFLSDLSARDFALLSRSGWWPIGLAAGASFVCAPRRGIGQWAAQQTQNVELPNLTAAFYQAREGAMGRMQQAGEAMRAEGVIQVKLQEGPLGRGGRVMQFIAVGTAVHLVEAEHRSVSPSMVVTLNDPVEAFAAESLRGAPGGEQGASG